MLKLNQIHQGDCLEVMKALPDNSVDSIVTDPPYGISFMNRHWDYDVPSVDIWRECLRVLKPGGHMLAFSGHGHSIEWLSTLRMLVLRSEIC